MSKILIEIRFIRETIVLVKSSDFKIMYGMVPVNKPWQYRSKTDVTGIVPDVADV
jgi:hypothetical protein